MATLLNGKALSETILNKLKQEINMLQIKAHLAVIQVGSKVDSSLYIKQKQKFALNSNFNFTLKSLSDSISESDLLKEIMILNLNSNIHGIIIQLPLPGHLNELVITDAVDPLKDVDGFHSNNIGLLVKRFSVPLFTPCTPLGIMNLLNEAKIDLSGKNAVVVGRSNIVGLPIANLLLQSDCTVSTCHSKTVNLKDIVKTADILVAAIGQPNYIKGDWLKPGVVVVDVGTNSIPDSTKKSGSRWVGDVDFEAAKHIASAITPVPGGVGPMTVAMLLQNTLLSAKRFHAKAIAPVTPLLLNLSSPVPSDIDIAMAQTPKLISILADEIGLEKTEVELYGRYKAKVSLDVLTRLNQTSNGKYIVVTGITPTPLGEGKSTTTIGLVQSLASTLSKKAFACVRQPSQGPTFGIKGGAAGGGYSQIIPMDEFNLHMTGDIHAIIAANNLLAAAIDTRILHESTQSDEALFNRLCPLENGVRKFSRIMIERVKKLGILKTNPSELTLEEVRLFVRLDINPDTITWNRVIDTNDRLLRKITIGIGEKFTRNTSFDIAVASELMAILALVKSLAEFKERVGRIVVAMSKSGRAVTCDDIGCTGAMMVLLKDTIKPNLMQTLEGTPVLVHAGPFANIAHGNSSIIADLIALKLADYVVTEAGFGADIGLEKFFDIKCRESGIFPDVIVLVATVRSLKMHGGGPNVVAGRPLDDMYKKENLELLEKGCSNMQKHISNALKFGVNVIVAVNQFSTDSIAELDLVVKLAREAGALNAVICDNWKYGGKGAVVLANSVMNACQEKVEPRFLYKSTDSLVKKIETVAVEMYGAEGVDFSPEASSKLELYETLYGSFNVCMAKTHLSFSDNALLKGVPTGFRITVRDLKVSTGAGFVTVICGDMTLMPGLSTRPGFYDVDLIQEDGKMKVVGLM